MKKWLHTFSKKGRLLSKFHRLGKAFYGLEKSEHPYTLVREGMTGYGHLKRNMTLLEDMTKQLKKKESGISLVVLVSDRKKEEKEIFQIWYEVIFYHKGDYYSLKLNVKSEGSIEQALRPVCHTYSGIILEYMRWDLIDRFELSWDVREKMDRISNELARFVQHLPEFRLHFAIGKLQYEKRTPL